MLWQTHYCGCRHGILIARGSESESERESEGLYSRNSHVPVEGELVPGNQGTRREAVEPAQTSPASSTQLTCQTQPLTVFIILR